VPKAKTVVPTNVSSPAQKKKTTKSAKKTTLSYTEVLELQRSQELADAKLKAPKEGLKQAHYENMLCEVQDGAVCVLEGVANREIIARDAFGAIEMTNKKYSSNLLFDIHRHSIFVRTIKRFISELNVKVKLHLLC
jgi:hypothetical protein